MEPVLSDPISLTDPIVRGSETISSVRIRKPNVGELRGLKLPDIIQGDIDAHIRILPRVTVPPLLANEIEAMDPVDFQALAAGVMLFFMTAEQKDFLESLSKT